MAHTRSAAFDGIAYDAAAFPLEEGEARDALIIEAGERED
jgi:hypothetical protein